MIVNKWYTRCSSITFAVSTIVSTILGWVGIALFLTSVNGSSIENQLVYKWSFILACTSAGLLTLLLPMSICYVCCAYNPPDDVSYGSSQPSPVMPHLKARSFYGNARHYNINIGYEGG